MNHPHLFSPGVIGDLEVRNRVVLPSMTTRLADPDGMVTPELTSYYRERARGGCGLVVVEMASPQVRGRHRRRELGITSDEHLEGLQSLTSAIRSHGACAGIQLGHGGARALPTELGGNPLAATAGPVSVFEAGSYVNYPEVADQAALEQLIEDHVRAAKRAEAAGFDLIELHGAHGYLLTQLSHQDENAVLPDALARYQYLAKFVRRVVEAVGVPVTYRINGQDYYKDGGHRLPDTLEFLSHLMSSGISAISVSGGHYLSDDPEIMIPPMPYPDGVFLADAHAVKQAARLPVIAAGRLNTPETAEKAIAEGQVDFVAIGRGQIADPHWTRKVQQGRRVRECLACNYCVREMRSGGRLSCAVNPLVTTADRPPAPAPQRRLVYGAGPAGLTYALESARAGHYVCLVARENRWRAASAPTFNGYATDRTRMKRYFDGLWKDCLEQGVEIVLEGEVSADWVAGADVVVDARGARYVKWVGAASWLVDQVLPLVPGRIARAVNRRLHHAFLYRLRHKQSLESLVPTGQPTVRVGDAARPGDLAAAVRNAYTEAWKGTHHAA